MKKILSLLLSCILVFSLAACGNTDNKDSKDSKDNKETNSSVPESSLAVNDTATPHNLGCILYGKEDNFGATVYAELNHAADALGSTINWSLGDYDATAQITAAENLIAAGVEGIIILPLSDTAVQKIAALCEQNKVYLALMNRTITDETIKAEVESHEYYLGCCFEDEVTASYQLMEYMEAAGRKMLGICYISEGTSIADRNKGTRNALAELDLTQVTEMTNPQDGDVSVVESTIYNMLTTNSNMDGFISLSAGSGFGETYLSVFAQVYGEGKDDVSIACFDTFEGIEKAFEDGVVTVCAAGTTPDSLFVFMMLYNAVDGHRLSETPVELNQNYIFATSAEECAILTAYCDNPNFMLYTSEDILDMAVCLNPDFNMDKMVEIMESYNIDWVVEHVAQ